MRPSLGGSRLMALLLFPLLAGVVGCGAEGDTASPAAPGGPPEQRLIEEGDIVRLDGDRLYVLNRYRGLHLLSLADPAHPRLLSRVPIAGVPLEMYVRQERVYALVSQYVDALPCDECAETGRGYVGSVVVAVDTHDASAPQTLGRIGIEGLVSDSRIVGDVLYAVSTRTGGWTWDSRSTDGTFVETIDLSDPARPHAIDRLEFPRQGQTVNIHVTDKLIYLATSDSLAFRGLGECGLQDRGAGCTQLTAIDIGSPDGRLRPGVSTFIAGVVNDRWSLSWDAGILRVVTRTGWASRQPARVRTFRASHARELESLAAVSLVTRENETVTAVRFDGPRAFVVTFHRTDPLFTVDLSDPERPFVAGHLETPGWLDHIVPRGDRLIALGHDRDRASDPWMLHVSLYDVADLSRPRLLDRALFGAGHWQEVAGRSNDLDKVMRVVDEQSLILVPYRAIIPEIDGWGGRPVGEVQLFSFTRDKLIAGGRIDHPGLVERALPLGTRHVVTVSQESAAVVDIGDRSAPRTVGALEIARRVVDGAIEGGRAVLLTGEPLSGAMRLVVTPADDPNAPEPLASLFIPAPNGRVFASGDDVAVVSSNANGGQARIEVFDLGTPGTIRSRGRLALSLGELIGPAGRGDAYGGPRDSVVQVRPGLIALVPPTGGAPGALVEFGPAGATEVARLPRPAGPSFGVLADGGTDLYLFARDWNDFERENEVLRFDVRDPANPRLLARGVTQGRVAAVRNGVVFSTFRPSAVSGTQRSVNAQLRAVRLDPGVAGASLVGDLALNGGTAAASDGRQALVWDGRAIGVVDLTDPARMRLTAHLAVPAGLLGPVGDATGDAWPLGLRGGRAFLVAGRGSAAVAGVLVYDVRDPERPRLQQFLRSAEEDTPRLLGSSSATDPVTLLTSGLYGVYDVDAQP